MLKLMFLPVNQAWSFVLGDTPTRLYPHGEPAQMLYTMRADAIETANQCGLIVLANGDTQAAHDNQGVDPTPKGWATV